ncbi:MAG TPA: peptidylprolyl isomerase [Vicinamibacteria bacterium]|nr:peptidylprolyl isomerase [Vicinamibacteria bacterium]
MRRLSALLLLPSLALASRGAEADVIERVVAKVNGQIITLSDFQSRQIAAAQGARIDPANVGAFLRQNNAKILQDAIDEILLLQKAEDAGIKAPPQWIDEAIDGIRKDNKITTDEQFQEALEREGLTLSELRQNIEHGVIRRAIMQRDVQPKIEASESEVRAEYEKLKATEFTKPPTVSLQEILIKEDLGGETLAREVVKRARADEDFATLAKTYSQAPSRSHGGDLGQLSQGEINPALEKVAFSLPVGGVSDPMAVEGGYRIVKVTAKTSGSTTPFESAKDKVRERLMMDRFEAAYEAYMQELRKTASVELRVREVPLQLTGPIPEGSLREALEPLAPGPGPVPPSSPGATDTIVTPTEKKPVPAPAADEEISTTPQSGPEKVSPPPAPAVPTSKEPKPPGR